MAEMLAGESFWEGVLASFVAAVITAILGYVVSIVFPAIREWYVNRRAKSQMLRQQLVSSDSATRHEANLKILFNVLQWLILAILFFIVSDFLSRVPVLYQLLFFSFRICGAVFLMLSLSWISTYRNLPNYSDEILPVNLLGKSWILYFGPPYNKKEITFLKNGRIGKGKNDNENTWKIINKKLELVQSDGRVHSRFAFDPRTGNFVHTNDTDTLSLRNQYIVPAK